MKKTLLIIFLLIPLWSLSQDFQVVVRDGDTVVDNVPLVNMRNIALWYVYAKNYKILYDSSVVQGGTLKYKISILEEKAKVQGVEISYLRTYISECDSISLFRKNELYDAEKKVTRRGTWVFVFGGTTIIATLIAILAIII